jgi:hypothetical protein
MFLDTSSTSSTSAYEVMIWLAAYNGGENRLSFRKWAEC